MGTTVLPHSLQEQHGVQAHLLLSRDKSMGPVAFYVHHFPMHH